MPPLAARMKYSSPILRPPKTASALSAAKSLLCMRWLTRDSLSSELNSLLAREPRARTKGLTRPLPLESGEIAQQRLDRVAVQVVDQEPDPHAPRGRIARAPAGTPLGRR